MPSNGGFGFLQTEKEKTMGKPEHPTIATAQHISGAVALATDILRSDFAAGKESSK